LTPTPQSGTPKIVAEERKRRPPPFDRPAPSGLTCFNNGATVTLHVRYDVIDRNLIRETLTTTTGDPVTEILFHRLSQKS
jgi:hypothetical protein